MECFITWQLERENSGLFDRKPITNSSLNETNELKKENEERKLEEQEKEKLEHSGQRPSTPSRPKPQLRIKPTMPRRGSQRLGMAQHPPSSKDTQSQRLGVQLNA
ncbi:hypothetical protein PIB30_103744 [Stylosanthes scabra]|uniref:Uncharacterized protein n=1 Tax=Stylosanthes scabra TaxID=79078 RepID=A0ABU6WWB4_9FABA|nr:hypothetical protein [Stylosanthes scabra]